MIVISILVIIISVAISIPILIFVVQVFASTFYEKGSREHQTKTRPSLAVLIPAHNESEIIGNTLTRLSDQILVKDRLLVVADNCSDDTAKICREHGVEVLERFDTRNQGKGHALAFGLQHLNLDPREVLVIVDADCQLAANCLSLLACSVDEVGRPTQAMYLMKAPAESNVKQRISQFAWIVKNKVRPLGYMILGLPCQLMGTGMAFPWSAVDTEDLDTSSIVEDLELGLTLAGRRCAPRFCPEAIVTSQFPAQDDAVKGQRTRWEHGHLRVMFKTAPTVLISSLRQRNFDLFALGLDLLVPPLALLVILDAIASILAMVVYLVGFGATALFILLIMNTLFAIAVLSSWRIHAKDILEAKDLIYIFGYLFWKIPIYLGFVKKPEATWIKTKRN